MYARQSMCHDDTIVHICAPVPMFQGGKDCGLGILILVDSQSETGKRGSQVLSGVGVVCVRTDIEGEGDDGVNPEVLGCHCPSYDGSQRT